MDVRDYAWLKTDWYGEIWYSRVAEEEESWDLVKSVMLIISLPCLFNTQHSLIRQCHIYCVTDNSFFSFQQMN